MDYEEFKTYFWSYIDKNIVTDYDLNINNKDFCDAVCYDCYRIFIQSNNSLDYICKLAENILFNVYRYKPMLNYN